MVAIDKKPIKCSAVHTLDRDMPTEDYSHLVEELRRLILEDANQNEGLYSKKDLDKCKTDEWFLSRYLLRQHLKLDAAFLMLKKAMRFRNENLIASIKKEDFPREFYRIGGVFGYQPDRKGNYMLYLRIRIHKRIPEVAEFLKAFIFYTIERLDERANGRGISFVFDCTGAGIANADMDMLYYIVTTLVNYFPKGLSYLLVHNLPWLLKPFWHIAKTWIAEEHRELIKFSDARTIYEYIDEENLPDFMGGCCKIDYTAAPENCSTLEQAAKVWGVEKELVNKIRAKFADHLPPDCLEQVDDEDNKGVSPAGTLDGSCQKEANQQDSPAVIGTTTIGRV